jgi:hypothetical protein
MFHKNQKTDMSDFRRVIRETIRDVLAEKASKEYCENTPVDEMGFTQRASCKAQGYIERSDGEKRKSDKYESINESHNDDNDGEHTLSKLQEAEKFAQMLRRRIRPGQDLPEWVVEKISLSAYHLNEVYQYLDTDV